MKTIMRRLINITIYNKSKGDDDPHGLNLFRIFSYKACLKNSKKGGFKIEQV